jgi:hypothetical protein
MFIYFFFILSHFLLELLLPVFTIDFMYSVFSFILIYLSYLIWDKKLSVLLLILITVIPSVSGRTYYLSPVFFLL